VKTRLSKRLKTLFNQVPSDYDAIWDLCCDHGRLGMALLETERAPLVHFNDSVASIMTELEQQLLRYGAVNFQLHLSPAEQLELPGQGRQLLILAGVGDELSLRIIDALSQQLPASQLDWLISPANNLFQVRQALQQRQFGLLDEGLVFDKGRGYEWLYVSQDRQRAGPDIDNPATFWDPSDTEHRRHLSKLLQHVRQQQRQPEQLHADAAANAYASLLEQS